MTRKEGLNLLVIGGGVAGQRIGTEKWFDESVTGRDPREMRAHIVDPNLPLPEFDLVHTPAALSDGRLTVGRDIPEGSFDVAYIASTTGTHVEWLDRLRELPIPQIIVEKPIASTEAEMAKLNELLAAGLLDEERVSVHESYLLLEGLQWLRRVIERQIYEGNLPKSINVLSAKDRTPDVRAGRTGNEPALGAYGVEFPHTHAAASFLADVELDDNKLLQRNDYYQAVNGDPASEATYTEFRTEQDVTVRVAQGLGPFTMTQLGGMIPNSHPGITREAEVTFADGRRVHLDVQPAVDSKAQTRLRPYRHTTLTHYDADNVRISKEIVPDFPFKSMLEGVLARLDGHDAPLLETVGAAASLERCIQMGRLRKSANIVSGKTLSYGS